VIDLADVAGQRVPQYLLEDRERAADFVERGHTAIAHFVGLPDGRHLAPQRIEGRVGFFRRQVEAVADGEGVGDTPMRLEQRPADDFRGMGGEHQLDPHRSHGVRERGGRQPSGAPAGERVGAGTGLRAMAGVARVVPAPADPVMLLGDVGQRQKVGERPRDRHGRRNRQIAQPVGELFEGERIAGVRALREGPDLLHSLEQLVAFAGAQRVAEQLAQQPHIVAQWLMRVAVRSAHSRAPSLSAV
jgi:hypothetical protein